jgi:hypothetical protein
LCYRTPTDANEDAECEDVDIKMNKAVVYFRGVKYPFYMNAKDTLTAFIDNFVLYLVNKDAAGKYVGFAAYRLSDGQEMTTELITGEDLEYLLNTDAVHCVDYFQQFLC